MGRVSKGLCISVVIVLLCIAAITTMDRREKSASDLVEQPMFECSMEIDGYRFSVQLYSTNAWLSEHDKYVSIFAPDGRLLAEEVFADPGGLMTMFFSNDTEEIIAMDGSANALTLHKRTQKVERGHRPKDAFRLYSDPFARSTIIDGQYTCRLTET